MSECVAYAQSLDVMELSASLTVSGNTSVAYTGAFLGIKPHERSNPLIELGVFTDIPSSLGNLIVRPIYICRWELKRVKTMDENNLASGFVQQLVENIKGTGGKVFSSLIGFYKLPESQKISQVFDLLSGEEAGRFLEAENLRSGGAILAVRPEFKAVGRTKYKLSYENEYIHDIEVSYENEYFYNILINLTTALAWLYNILLKNNLNEIISGWNISSGELYKNIVKINNLSVYKVFTRNSRAPIIFNYWPKKPSPKACIISKQEDLEKCTGKTHLYIRPRLLYKILDRLAEKESQLLKALFILNTIKKAI